MYSYRKEQILLFYVSVGIGQRVQLGDGPGLLSLTSDLNSSRARAYYPFSRCGWELFGYSFSCLLSLLFLPLSG